MAWSSFFSVGNLDHRLLIEIAYSRKLTGYCRRWIHGVTLNAALASMAAPTTCNPRDAKSRSILLRTATVSMQPSHSVEKRTRITYFPRRFLKY